MNFFKKLLKDDEVYDEKYRNDYVADDADTEMIDDIPPAEGIPEQSPSSSGKTGDVSLRVMRPKSYDDGPEIADYVASGCTVVMNIEDLNRENSRRLIDFLLGAVHVLGGDMQMASQTTFVVAPCNVSVPEDMDTDNSSGFTFS